MIKKYSVFFAVVVLMTTPVFAEPPPRVTARELINENKAWDGKKVLFKGEVIGDIMARGDFVWVNVQDETNTIGVLAGKEFARELSQGGDYQHRGDIVEIEGKFFKADASLGGEMCIRAEKYVMIKKGYQTFHVLLPQKKETMMALFFVTFFCVAATVFIVKNRRRREKRRMRI